MVTVSSLKMLGILNGPYSKEKLQCFKNLLDGRQYVTNGWVSNFSGLSLLDGNILIRAKVTHSQSLHKLPLNPWMLISKTGGSVIAAHCDCVAGWGILFNYSFFQNNNLFPIRLDAVCIHISAILHTVCDFSEKRTCKKSTAVPVTSLPCSWIDSYRKPVW